MKLFGAAALAAVIAFACPALADEACPVDKQLSHDKEVAAEALKSGRFSAVLDLTGDELAAFAKAANDQFGTNIPRGGIEELMVIAVDGKVVVFGFVGGCQVGMATLPAMPSKTSAPALLPHGQRLI